LTDCPPTDAFGVLATNSADPFSEFSYPAAHVVADTCAFTPATSNSCSMVNGFGSSPRTPLGRG